MEALSSGASQEFEEEELKLMLFNLCREIKAILLAFTRPAFVGGAEEANAELAQLAAISDHIGECLNALSRDMPAD